MTARRRPLLLRDKKAMVPLRVTLALYVVVALVVVVSVFWHLYNHYWQTAQHLKERVHAVTQTQAVSVADQWQLAEQTLGRLAVYLNTRAVLGVDSEEDRLEGLRSFQTLVPDALDLLWVQNDGAVLAASSSLAQTTPLSTYCPAFSQHRAQIEQSQWWVITPELATQRCPPSGTLVFRLAHQAGRSLTGGQLWLLLRNSRFTERLKAELPDKLPQHRYRLWWQDRTELAAGVLQGPNPMPADLSNWQFVTSRVQDSDLHVEVYYPEYQAVLTGVEKYWWLWGSLVAAFLAFWSMLGALTLRMVYRFQSALVENEERFERSLNNAKVGVWEWDFTTGILQWSPQIAEFFDLPPDSLQGNAADFLARVHPEDRPKVEAAVAACIKHKTIYNQEYRVVSENKPSRWVHSHGDVQRNSKGRAVRMFGVMQNATERIQAATRLAEIAGHTQVILDNVVDAIITIDEQGLIESFNAAATRVFGYSPEEVHGRNVNILMPEPYRSEHDGYLEAHQRTGINKVIGVGREVVGLHKNGREFPMNLAVSVVVRGGKRFYIGLVRDITQQRKAEAEIQHLAFFDHLTNLPNRRLLLDRIKRTILACERNGQIAALAMLDLDDFKTLNDTRGHEAGDLLLVELSGRLTQAVREGDTVARLGGDEFVVLLDNLGKDKADAALHAESTARKLLQIFQEPFHPHGREHRTSASMGLTLFDGQTANPDTLLGQTDMAMYQAKSGGRNTFRFFDAELQVSLNTRAALERDLLLALEQRAFSLAYQPQVDQKGQTTGFEALIRWRHPVRGLVSPAQFIPIAEQTGFIQRLGHWVLQTACEKLVVWAAHPSTSSYTLAINVSAHQFRSPDFVREVLDTLASTGADPSRLKLELTESMLADDIDSLIVKMSALQAHGVQFSLDDFGTGYSSLSYLKRLPLDQLKIDQSFVRDLLTDSNDAAIVKAIITLGQSLGLGVIAEGVETAEQQHFLADSGCTEYQGYLFGRPLDSSGLDAYLATQ